jgi:cysteinyl-tRNA synthetase
MAMKFLGQSFEIHTGGKDLKFPHHENEIAQSEALTGKRFVKFWLHAEFLNINGEKMSKSLGNFVTFRDLRQQGWSARAIRLFLISAHYRDELNLTDGSMPQAEATMKKIDEFLERLSRGRPSAGGGRASLSLPLVKSLVQSFDKAMDDDLNTPGALAAVFGFQRRVNALIDAKKLSRGDYKAITDSLAKVDEVLGIMQFDGRRSRPEAKDVARPKEDSEVRALVNEREQARKLKDYARADVIREKLSERGIVVQDTPEGPIWRRLSTPA